jgi:signal peptide peptidase SppA
MFGLKGIPWAIQREALPAICDLYERALGSGSLASGGMVKSKRGMRFGETYTMDILPAVREGRYSGAKTGTPPAQPVKRNEEHSPAAVLPGKENRLLCGPVGSGALYQVDPGDREVFYSGAGVLGARAGQITGAGASRYTVENGVAVIPIWGMLTKRYSVLTQLFGGTAMEDAGADLRAALENPEVKGIFLDIDSIGGPGDGVTDLAGKVYAARKQKPVVAFSDGAMLSAAIWIGVAADRVYLANETVGSGSIGVLAMHTDFSKAEEQAGIKTTVISAGKYKALGNRYEPLSKEGRDILQEQIDYMYGLFVRDVAKYRGTSEKTVLEKMADGRVFFGNQAVRAGLVDGLMSKRQLLQSLSRGELPAGNAGGKSSSQSPAAAAYKTSSAALDALPPWMRNKRDAIARWDADAGLRAEYGYRLDAFLFMEDTKKFNKKALV